MNPGLEIDFYKIGGRIFFVTSSLTLFNLTLSSRNYRWEILLCCSGTTKGNVSKHFILYSLNGNI
jgi:hypothetical protein